MTTTTEPTEPRVRPVPTGTMVIHAAYAGEFEYDGRNDDDRFTSMDLGFGRKHKGIKCHPYLVAPADTPIPAKSDRVNVTKRFPTPHGPWLLAVDGQGLGYHRTKRDATAGGLRTVAILDWHASDPEPVAQPDPEPTAEADTTDDKLAQLEQLEHRLAEALLV